VCEDNPFLEQSLDGQANRAQHVTVHDHLNKYIATLILRFLPCDGNWEVYEVCNQQEIGFILMFVCSG
jgi:hypothetical protein